MRVLGLLITLGGCALAVASLWAVWARGQPGPLPAPDRDGWSWMALGDVLLVTACATVAAVSLAFAAKGRSARATRVAIVSVAGILLGAIAMVALVKLLTGLNLEFPEEQPKPQPRYDDGPGQGRAVAGLTIALVGSFVSLAAGHRRAPRRRRYSAPGVPGTTGRSGSSTWKDDPAPSDDST